MTEKTWLKLSDIIAGIESIPAEIRALAKQPEDREALDIVHRIERRLLAKDAAETHEPIS